MAGARGNRRGTWATTSLIVFKKTCHNRTGVFPVCWRYRCANRAEGTATPLSLGLLQPAWGSYMNILYSGTCTYLHWKWLINIKVHFHFKIKRMRDCLSPFLTWQHKRYIAKILTVLPSVLHSIHALTFTMYASALFVKTRGTVSGLLKFTLSNRSFLHTCWIYVSPSNRVQECMKTDIDPKPHLCFYRDNKAPNIQHFSQTIIIIYCQINILMFASIHCDISEVFPRPFLESLSSCA